MADSSIDKPKEADPSQEDPALHDEVVDTLGDEDVSQRLEFDETDKLDETNEADKSVEVGDKVQPSSDFLDFLEYRARNVMVKRSSRVIYNVTRENLVERQDVIFQGFDWFRHFSWTNQSNLPDQRSRTVEEGLVVRTGQETERNFSVGGAFKGLSMNVGGSRREFSERETSRSVSITKTVNVEPQATTSFYQKRYNFLVEVWFWQRVPGWEPHANHFGIGETGAASRTIKRTAEIEIFSEDFATLLHRLNGSTTITVTAAPRPRDDPPLNRQFINITQRAKDHLRTVGIRG